MIDISILREQTERVRAAIARKKFSCDLDAVLELDRQRRQLVTDTESLRARQNAANQEIRTMEKGSDAFKIKIAEMKTLSEEVKSADARTREIDELWKQAMLTIPNMPHESVPAGRGDQDNKVVYEWLPEGFDKDAPGSPHWEIPGINAFLDFNRGVKVTGAGFPFYRGALARLNRALIQSLLDEAVKMGYEEIQPPHMVNAASATATGQLPDKEGQMYQVINDDLYLIPTAEVPVTNYYRDEILNEADLPLKFCAYTPCFRREAGSWGKDVRGLNRLHQFDKVELVKWVAPKNSFEELESLRKNAEHMLQALQLPYRVLEICAGDIGFPHSKQFDLEVWSRGQKRWLEVSSCSNFTDFQARRAQIRYRNKEGKVEPVHTLNGSALGMSRTLAAILENNHVGDGEIVVPQLLRPRFGSEKFTLVR
ncbi:MAG TPA: serine--tRNA ligase [Opitutales bacterium]|nr:serine--tRNA ligase [Opitutales bacterium]